jgi:hypothetical protein
LVLFDGHLSVDNSDVRAGANHLVHVSRWEGLLAWWRNLFTLHGHEEEYDDADRDNFLSFVDGEPRLTDDADIEMVVEDFLSAWLVERNVGEAVKYLSEPALNCVHGLDHDSSDAYAALRIFTSMERTLEQIPEGATLDSLAQRQPIPNQALRPMSDGRTEVFELVDVPPTVAAALLCPGGDTWRAAARIHNRRPYRGTSLSVTGADGSGFDLFLLWGREAGHWKIIALHYDGYRTPEALLNMERSDSRGASATQPPRRPSDPDFEETAERFLQTWFIDHAYDDLRPFYSRRCYACIEVFHPEFPPARDDDQAWQQLRSGIETIAAAVSRPGALEEEISAVHPWNPLLPIMEHSRADAYTLLEVPNHLAESFDCTNRAATRYHEPLVGDPVYGNYRALVFSLRLAGEHAPAFLTLWQQEAGEWKIVSFESLEH